MSKGTRVFALLAVLWFLNPVDRVGSPNLLAEERNQAVTPEWSKATLTDGALVRQVRRTEKVVGSEHPSGDGAIRVEGGTVEFLDATGAVRWRHTAEDPITVRYLAESEGIVFLSEYRASDAGDPSEGAALRRLRVSDGEKLEGLAIPADQAETAMRMRVQDAIVFENALIILSETLEKTEEGWRPRSYRVSRYLQGWTWSRSFLSKGELPRPGAFLLGSFGPARDQASIQSLTRMGETLLVCAGPLEDVLALDSTSGRTKWQVPRLWEYQRGFMGPSVWSYFIARYGMDEFQAEMGAKSAEEIRKMNAQREGPKMDEEYHHSVQDVFNKKKKVAENRHCSIIAGPIVVPLLPDEESENEDRFSLFIATSQGDAEAWSNYLANCVIYELDENGKCLGMATIPRFVDGPLFTVFESSVIWCCGSMNRLRLFPSQRSFGVGGGNSDMTVDFEWEPRRRRLPASPEGRREAWLCQGAFYADTAFREKWMLSITEGGYLEHRESQVFQYPLTMTDLKSDRQRTLILNLPFVGKAESPNNNYSRSRGTWTTLSEYLMTIRSVDMIDGRLLVTFQFGDEIQRLTFDCNEAPEPKD